MNIKRTIATTSICIALSQLAWGVAPASAAEKDGNKVVEGSIFGGAVVGAAAGGPVGAIVGAITGAYASEKHQYNKAQKELTQTRNEVTTMKAELAKREEHINRMEEAAAQRLEFQVLFSTGDDQLSQTDVKRLKSVARYLANNPELTIYLEGHADPRGTDEYNYVLSEERVKSVIAQLEQYGIDRSRIDFSAYGADRSTAYLGDLEAYALERKVQISVAPEEKNKIASSH